MSNKETFWKDSDGYWKDGSFIMFSVCAILLCIVIALTIQVISDKNEVGVFNRIQGTNYTWQE